MTCRGILYSTVAFLFLFMGEGSFAQDPPFEWVTRDGGMSDEVGRSISMDSEGNIYITGDFEGQSRFGESKLVSAGGSDAFCSKYNSDGNIIWTIPIHGEDDVVGVSVENDQNNNVIITGRFKNSIEFGGITAELVYAELTTNDAQNIFLCKYDPEGSLIWAKQAGGSKGDAPYEITCDPDNNIYLTGYFQDHAYFDQEEIISAGSLDLFIAKYDESGNLVWVQPSGGIGNDIGYGIAINPDRELYVTGTFSAPLDFGISGVTGENVMLSPIGAIDMFVAKFSSDGSIHWAQQAGTTIMDTDSTWFGTLCKGLSITCHNSQDENILYVTGRTVGDVQFTDTTFSSTGTYIAKYGDDGGFVHAFNSGGYQGNAILTDPAGNLFITGYYSGETVFSGLHSFYVTTRTSKGESDIFVARYDSLCNLDWITTAGGYAQTSGVYSTDAGEDMLLDIHNNVFITGQFSDSYYGDARFGDIEIEAVGGRDVFTAKIGLRIDSLSLENLSCDDEQDGMIEVFTEGGLPPISFSVDGGVSFQPVLQAAGLTKGVYPIVVRDNNGYMVRDTVTLRGPVNLGNDTLLCRGTIIDGGSGFNQYNWNNGLSTDRFLEVVESGEYSLEVTDLNNCHSTDTIEIMVPEGVQLGNDTILCQGSFYEAPEFYLSYNWNDGLSLSRLVKVMQSGAYYVDVIDEFGCHSSDTVIMTTLPAPQTEFGNDTVIGTDETVVLDAGSGDYTYLWNDGDTGQTKMIDSLSIGLGTLEYSVMVAGANGCVTYDTIIVSIESAYLEELVLSPSTCDVNHAVINDPNYGVMQFRDYFLARSTLKDEETWDFRSLLEFDLSAAAGREISVAYLSLFSPSEGFQHEFSDGSNGCILRRILTSWPIYLSWRRQPLITQQNEVILPESTQHRQDYLNIEVTEIARDMLMNPEQSFGFMFMLRSEEPERALVFCSPTYDDASKHPKLTLYYEKGATGISDRSANGRDISIYPNPADDILNIRFAEPAREKLTITVFDITGKQVFQKEIGTIPAGYTETIDLSELQSGIYFIRIQDNERVNIGKLMIR